MKPSTALGIILDLVSNSQLLCSIVTQICVYETLTINLRAFFHSPQRAENVSVVSWRNFTYVTVLKQAGKSSYVESNINKKIAKSNICYVKPKYIIYSMCLLNGQLLVSALRNSQNPNGVKSCLSSLTPTLRRVIYWGCSSPLLQSKKNPEFPPKEQCIFIIRSKANFNMKPHTVK